MLATTTRTTTTTTITTPDLYWHQYVHLCYLYWLLDKSNLYK